MRRPCVRLALVAALSVFSVAASTDAFAQPDEPNDGPSASDKETARTLFREGDEMYRAGDFEGALKAFKAADEIMGVPTTGLEYARTLMKLGRLVEARDGFIRVANAEPQPGEQPAQQTARNEAKQLAEALQRRIPAIRVLAVNAPKGAVVTLRVDDVAIPPTAVEFPRKVDPGEHTIELTVEGFKSVTRQVTVVEKEEKVVEITLEKAEASATTVDPWEKGDDERGLLPTLSWIGFGVGAAGLAVGIPTGIFAVSEADRFGDVCAGQLCSPEHESDLDTATTLAHVSTVGFVFAGLGIAAGVTGLLLWDALPDALANDEGLTIEPFVGLGAAGVSGRF